MQTKQNMTPVRACQLATALLNRIEQKHTFTNEPNVYYISGEEARAIAALREIAARVATGLVGRKTP